MLRDPHQLGVERSRWTLSHLLACCRDLRLHSRSGLWRLLSRLGIHPKRARSSTHRPDPAYDEKLARIEALKQRVQAHPEEVLLYQDECTIHQQPSVAHAYDLAGAARPYASQSTRIQLSMRVVATLDALERASPLQKSGQNRHQTIERLVSMRAGQLSDGRAHLAHPG